MQNAEWISLFRQIPKEFHGQLILVSQNRSEVSVETIFRLEPSFMVVRGRLGGTTEGGLLFLFPYDQLSTVCLSKELKEEEIGRLFESSANVGRLAAASHQATNGTPKSHQAAGTRPSAVPAPAPTPVAATARPAGDATSVARNNLLERLRAARNAAIPSAGK